ncbi:MAG: hypothetical protein M9927_08820 [Anaerolineae bacterium]|nr:hypothetical protein [Anaerolineae bacterium]
MNSVHSTSGKSGIGTLHSLDHQIDGVEYVITRVGQFEQSEVGVVILAPDAGLALRQAYTTSAHLELADGQRLAITLYDLSFLNCASQPQEPQYVCFEVVDPSIVG